MSEANGEDVVLDDWAKSKTNVKKDNFRATMLSAQTGENVLQ
jgi:hypothetical protein